LVVLASAGTVANSKDTVSAASPAVAAAAAVGQTAEIFAHLQTAAT
jgi:hypothetical protein